MSHTELALLGQVVLGYATQWLRGLQKVPNWVSYAGLGIASILVYVWISPNAMPDFKADWRAALAGLVSFILASRGGASVSSDTKAAPKTNTL